VTHALELELPMGWSIVERSGCVVAEQAWLRLDVQTPIPFPEDRDRWRLDRIRLAEAPASVRVISSSLGASTWRWPVELIDAIVVNGDAVLEARFIANYDMLGHAVSVVARVADRALGAQHLSSLRSIIASARPIWRSETPESLAVLWSLVSQSNN
jgi:hypothetical protein